MVARQSATLLSGPCDPRNAAWSLPSPRVFPHRPVPPRNGSEAAAAADAELDRFMHLAALNRGILLTPFHNMALMAPATSAADVDRHTAVFRECVEMLLGLGRQQQQQGPPLQQATSKL